jgi:hypothetical protein
MIGITPQGVISFISSGYGGRASDKMITKNCGFLNKLLPGDLVLAERGCQATTNANNFVQCTVLVVLHDQIVNGYS